VHVLHRLGASTPDIDREWMRNLPSELPEATAADANPYGVTLLAPKDAAGNQSLAPSKRDGVRQLALPWTVIATVDAYPNGGVLDRAKALRLIQELCESLSQVAKPVMSGIPFAAAELEISLRYLKGDKQQNRDII